MCPLDMLQCGEFDQLEQVIAHLKTVHGCKSYRATHNAEKNYLVFEVNVASTEKTRGIWPIRIVTVAMQDNYSFTFLCYMVHIGDQLCFLVRALQRGLINDKQFEASASIGILGTDAAHLFEGPIYNLDYFPNPAITLGYYLSLSEQQLKNVRFACQNNPSNEIYKFEVKLNLKHVQLLESVNTEQKKLNK